MNEAAWLTSADPESMVRFLGDRISERKLRLFTLGCVRGFWDILPSDPLRRAVEAAERHADGKVTDRELGRFVTDVNRHRRRRSGLGGAVYDAVRYTPGTVHWWSVTGFLALAAANRAVPDVPPVAMTNFEGDRIVHVVFPMSSKRAAWDAAHAGEHARQCDVLRDVVGNSFVPVADLNPTWLTPAVQHLAQAVYDGRAFDRLPELAIALEHAGCTLPDVLDHCRRPGPHVLGCWVLDLVVGKR